MGLSCGMGKCVFILMIYLAAKATTTEATATTPATEKQKRARGRYFSGTHPLLFFVAAVVAIASVDVAFAVIDVAFAASTSSRS